MFHEAQYPPWWVYLILTWSGLLLPIILSVIGRHQGKQQRGFVAGILYAFSALTFLLSALLFALFGRMSTEVTAGEARVSFGFVPSYSRTIARADIAKVEPMTYEPSHYGGWGIRGSERDGVLSMRGDQGVRLHLKDESLLLIGSQQPEALAAAVEKMRLAAER